MEYISRHCGNGEGGFAVGESGGVSPECGSGGGLPDREREGILRGLGELKRQNALFSKAIDDAIRGVERGKFENPVGALFQARELAGSGDKTFIRLYEALALVASAMGGDSRFPGMEYAAEELDGGRILRFVFPFIGYTRSFYQGKHARVTSSGFTRHMAERSCRGYFEKAGGAEGPFGGDAASAPFFRDPFMLFVYRFSYARRNGIDSDNIETKAFIDALSGRFFASDGACSLTTMYTGAKGDRDLTEIYLCETGDMGKCIATAGIRTKQGR